MKQKVIQPSEVGRRLDVVCANWLGVSRAQVKKLIDQGRITVIDKPERPSYLLASGDSLQANLVKSTPEVHTPPPLPIMYEDAFCLVIDKPAGLATEAAKGPTVIDFARTVTDDNNPTRPGIVHRLDRDTSGLLIIAKTAAAKLFLQSEFKKHSVKKTYLALVRGHLRPSQAVIKLPLGRNLSKPTTRQVAASGRAAETSYRVRQYYEGYTLVDAHPKTGRTHQLRVHFSFVGHPIAGDKTYGQAEPHLQRLFLHASELNFSPQPGKEVLVQSPLPPELENFLQELQTV